MSCGRITEKLFAKELVGGSWGFGLFGFIAFVLFALFLWHIAITSKETDRLPLYLIAAVWSIACILFCAGLIRTTTALHGEYCITTQSILVTCGQCYATINLDEPFYLSQMKISFYLRVGKIENDYLLLSAKPIEGIIQEYAGVAAIKKAIKYETILLPLDNHTREWLKDDLGIYEVSYFPKVMYFPRRGQHKDFLA